MSLDLIPMLLLSLLLMTAGGDVRTVEFVLGGEHEATASRGGLIVGDGLVTVPAAAAVRGPIHLLGGETRVAGTVTGDVTQLAGTLVVEDGASILGTLQHVSGTLVVAPGAQVARQAGLDVAARQPGLVGRFLPGVLLTGLLALVAVRRARRRPRTLEHFRSTLEHHPVISLTVGALVTVTFLSLFVFMAFTLVLLPVSILGLAVGLVIVGYGVVALATVVARRLPFDRPALASASGVAAVMGGFQLLGAIPIVGSVAVGALLLSGVGAVLLSYFGLKEFTPVAIPE